MDIPVLNSIVQRIDSLHHQRARRVDIETQDWSGTFLQEQRNHL